MSRDFGREPVPPSMVTVRVAPLFFSAGLMERLSRERFRASAGEIVDRECQAASTTSPSIVVDYKVRFGRWARRRAPLIPSSTFNLARHAETIVHKVAVAFLTQTTFNDNTLLPAMSAFNVVLQLTQPGSSNSRHVGGPTHKNTHIAMVLGGGQGPCAWTSM